MGRRVGTLDCGTNSMSDKLIIKTQRQLVELIVSHSKYYICIFCEKGLGKLVHIPIDPENNPVVMPCCLDCFKLLTGRRAKWCKRLLRALTEKGHYESVREG